MSSERESPASPAQTCLILEPRTQLLLSRRAVCEARKELQRGRTQNIDVRRASEAVAVEHLRDRARRIRGEINQRVRQPEAVRYGIGRRVGVHEHGGPSSVEFSEHGLEPWISKVNPPDVRKQQHAIACVAI